MRNAGERETYSEMARYADKLNKRRSFQETVPKGQSFNDKIFVVGWLHIEMIWKLLYIEARGILFASRTLVQVTLER